MPFNKEFIDKLRGKIDIIDYIGEYVELDRRGENFWGRCPFHKETKPSMSVSPKRQIFKCFGCGEGGSVIAFAIKFHDMTFPEAIGHLADLASLELPSMTSEEKLTQELYNFNRNLTNVYEANFSYYPQLTQPITESFRSDTLRAFKVGLAVDVVPGFFHQPDTTYAQILGLFNEDGSLYFKNRIMYPTLNLSGQVVGFYGRAVDSNQPVKHLNSRESLIFKKKKHLFGLKQALSKIKDTRSVFIVEGPKDVMRLHQLGVKNTVSSNGTALTPYQITTLKKFANTALLMYDGDPGGREAALNNGKSLLESGFIVQFVYVPDGQDPDSWLEEATSWNPIPFSIPHYLNFFKSPKLSAEEKMLAVGEVVNLLKVVPDELYLQMLVNETARVYQVSEAYLWERLEGSFKIETIPSVSTPVITEAWEQVALGLSYLPQYASNVSQFFTNQGRGCAPELNTVLSAMIVEGINTQAEWTEYVKSTNLKVPLFSLVLDQMSEDEIKETILSAAKTCVSLDIMEEMKDAVKNNLRETLESLRKKLSQLDTLTVIQDLPG